MTEPTVGDLMLLATPQGVVAVEGLTLFDADDYDPDRDQFDVWSALGGRGDQA